MYPNKSFAVELLLVGSAGGCDEVNKFYFFAVNLHLIIRMDDKLRSSVSINEMVAIWDTTVISDVVITRWRN